MCTDILSSAIERRKQIADIFGSQDYIIVYKEMDYHTKVSFHSPYWYDNHRHSMMRLNEWYISNRKCKKLTPSEKRYSLINCGIHVYLNEISETTHAGIVIKCKAYKDDIIAISSDTTEAVFMKVLPIERVK